jgi:hypothetical protein
MIKLPRIIPAKSSLPIATLAALLMCLAACGKAPGNAQPQGKPSAQAATSPPAAKPPANLPEVNIDQLERSKDSITITGWQTVDETPDYSIAFVDGETVLTFPHMVINRPDVGDLARKAVSDNLGFRTTVTPSDIRPGNYRLGIRTGAQEGNHVVLSTTKLQIPANPMQPAPTIAEQEGNITFFLDKVAMGDDFATIAGWAYRIDTNWTKDEPIIVILNSGPDSYAFPTYLNPRPDVAEKYNDSRLVNVGFAAFINVGTLAQGRYEVSIAILSPEGWVAKKTGRILAL